ncbi:MAG: sugar ABC transporter ATP-binding protein [Capsulimonas sp.]|uniref:sugar ABC transporter ATP-binding protein n=1 Tax=Capsulimonas sp. TaxID=2494211 RepID=UPI003265F931
MGHPVNVASAPLLLMTDIEKSFPGVRAIKHGHLEVRAGEVHALMGENGAGKSTLIKILSGAHRPDGGSIAIDGAPITIKNPLDSQAHGIAVIYQEFNLVPTLSARENIFLGQEPGRGALLSIADEQRRALELFERLETRIPPATLCRDLSVAQQQVVEIAKALARNARILVMDEPTAALSQNEVEKLFAIIEDLRAQGLGIIYVSHRLDEIFRLCDRITVMRDGEYITTEPTSQLTRQRVIELMVGRKLENEFPKREPKIGPARLEVRGLRRGAAVRGVSFDLRRGEVLGVTGLVGSGRTETARLLFGADRRDAGEIRLDGRPLALRSPADAIRERICLLTEDRKAQGLVLGLSIRENFGLPNLNAFSRWGLVRRGEEKHAFAQYIESLRIKVSHQEQPARNLSGGNQQKVVLAKWLQSNADIIIIDEPTRGIDVGAKYEIYLLINELAAQGKSILMISSELPEVLGMSDRILVMHEGRIAGEIEDVAHATQEQILGFTVAHIDVAVSA